MATIKNTVQNNIVSTGAEKATKDMDNLGRAQTRMGQASASAGRSFAAQSAGLGGLVGAYAGAAATVFALQAAFEALAKAAQAETIVKGTSALAAEIGQSGPRILKSIKDITQGQLTLEEASNAANLALSSGFNTEQIEQLAKVSLGASRALGRNLTDAMTRVVRGAAKMEPELLDELGIFTRIEPAVAAYAAKMNIAATSLTEFERRQAFANAVIEEGTRKFSGIDTSSGSAQKSLEQLSVKVIELGTEFGQILNSILKPVVDFFKNDFGNTLLLFLGVLTLVFGKAGAILGGFVNQGITKLATLSTAMADFAGKAGNLNLAPVEGSMTTARNEAFKPGKGGRRGSFNPNIAGRSAEQTAALTAALEKQRDGSLKTASAIEANNRVLKENAKITGLSAQRTTFLNTVIQQNDIALKSANKSSLLFIGTSRVLQAAVAGLTTGFSYLMMAVNGLFAAIAVAQLVGTLFDVDILGGILDFFKNISAATERMKAGFLGLAEASGPKSLAEQFKAVGATDDQIEGIADRINEVRESLEGLGEVNSSTRNQIMAARRSELENLMSTMEPQEDAVGPGLVPGLLGSTGQDSARYLTPDLDTSTLTSAQALGNLSIQSGTEAETKYLAAVQAAAQAIRDRNAIVQDSVDNGTRIYASALNELDVRQKLRAIETAAKVNANIDMTNAEKQFDITQQLAETRADMVGITDPDDLSRLKQTEIILKSILKLLEDGTEKIAPLIAGAAESTGVNIAKVSDSLKARSVTEADGQVKVNLFDEELKRTDKGITDYVGQTEDMQKLIDSFVLADTTLTDLNKAFREGTTSSGSLSKGIFGIQSQLDNLSKAGKQGTQDFKDLQERLTRLVDINEELKRTEKVTKAIRGAFSGEMKAIDNSVQEGSLSLTKEVAKTELDRVKNQRALLLLAINRGKALEREQFIFAKMSGEEMQLNEQQQAIEVQSQAARKAAQGVALQLVETNAKELLQLEKKNQQLTDNLSKVNQQVQISLKQARLEEQKLRLLKEQAAEQQKISIIAINIKQAQLDMKYYAQEAEFAKKRTAELEKQRVLIQDINTINRDSAASSLASSNERQNTAANEEIAKADANKFVTGKMLLAMQKRQADIEYVQQVTLIAQRKKDAREDATESLRVIGAQKQAIYEDNREKRSQIFNLKELNKLELDKFDKEKALEIKKLEDSKANLTSQQTIAAAQENLAIFNLNAQGRLMAFDKTKMTAEIDLRKQDIQFVNQFSAAINRMGEIVDAYVKATPGATTPQGPTAPLTTSLTTDLEEINELAQTNFTLAEDAIANQITGLQKVSVIQLRVDRAAKEQITQRITDQEALNEIERLYIKDNANLKLDALEDEIDLNNDKLNTLDKEDQKIIAIMKAKIEALEQERLGIVQLKQLEEDRRRVAASERKIDRTFVDAEIKLMQVNLQNAQTLLDISQKQLQIQKQRRDFALSEKLANQGLEDEIRGALGLSDELSKLKSFMATKDDKLGAAGADRDAAVKGAKNTAAVANQALALQQKQFEAEKFYRQRQLALDLAALDRLKKIAGEGGMTQAERDAGAGRVQGVNDDQSIARLAKLNQDIENAYMAGFGYQKTAIAKQQQLETEAANQKYNSTKAALDREQQLLELYASARYQLYKKLNASINQGVSDLINKVFDNIAEGKSIKDGLGDIFKETFKNIRRNVLEQTLIKPVQKAMTSITSSLFGFDVNETKGADNATVSGDGSLHVKVMGGAGAGGKGDPISEAKKGIEEKGMGFFEGFKQKAMDVFSSMKTGISNFGSSAMDIFKNLGGSLGGALQGVMGGLGGLLQGAGSGIGNFLSTGFSAITSMFGGGGVPMATGGLVGVRHMAEGGRVNALRDRVPAMLEPGEFVMRKPAVKSIGAGNLGQMNATGGSMGNVQFNIVNEGAPKEAEQQGQPRLDADKIVVDVVMRDLASNGPIRQAMRSG